MPKTKKHKMLTIALSDWQEQLIFNLRRADVSLVAKARRLEEEIDAKTKELSVIIQYKDEEARKTYGPIAKHHDLPYIPGSFVAGERDKFDRLTITFIDPRTNGTNGTGKKTSKRKVAKKAAKKVMKKGGKKKKATKKV